MMAAIIVFTAGIIMTALSVCVVPESERLVILKLGRFECIRGPGLVWTTPFIEKRILVILDRDIPNWRSLRNDQLIIEVVRFLTMSGYIK